MSNAATLMIPCECNSLECRLAIEMPVDTVDDFKNRGLVLILSGYKRGPEPTDTFVEEGSLGKYKLYRPAEE